MNKYSFFNKTVPYGQYNCEDTYIFLLLKGPVTPSVESFDKLLHASIYFQYENFILLAGTSLPINNDYLINVTIIKGKDKDSYSNYKLKNIILANNPVASLQGY
jgi:hypothetical protein